MRRKSDAAVLVEAAWVAGNAIVAAWLNRHVPEPYMVRFYKSTYIGFSVPRWKLHSIS